MRRKILSLGLASLIGAGAVFAYWLFAGPFVFLSPTERQEAMSSFDPFTLDPEDSSQPLLRDGERVSLARAQLDLPIEVLRPQHSLASDSSLSQVWVGTKDVTEVGIRYQSGIRVYLTMWPVNKDPGSFYRELVAESGAGKVVLVGGNPAWVVEQHEQAPGYPPTSVIDITIGNIDVSIYGDYSTDQLLEVAKTVT